MTITLSPLVHIEIVVHDADAAYEFLARVFGAERVEKEFSDHLEGFGTMKKIVHVNLGGTILQFIEPGDYKTWGKQLKDCGPSVHNITFQVPNVQQALDACLAEGAKPHTLIPIDLKKLLGPDTPTPTEPNVCIVDTMDKLGFRLELFHRPGDAPAAALG